MRGKHSKRITEQHSRVCLELPRFTQQPDKPCTTTTCKVATYVWMSARVLLTLESTPRRMAVTRLLALWVARYVRY